MIRTSNFLNPNPVLVVSFIWIFAIFLYSFKVSYLLIPISPSFLNVMLLSFASFLISYKASTFLSVPFRYTALQLSDRRIFVVTKRLFNILIIIFAVEVMFSGGVPIIWLFDGSGRTYFDFGIPSLHGLWNAMASFLFTLLMGMYFTTKKISYLWRALLLFSLTIVLITRQVAIVMIIQSLFLFIIVHPVRMKHIIRVGFMMIMMVFGFSILGDIRSGASAFKSVAAIRPEWEHISNIALWPYMYITTPISNWIWQLSRELPNLYGVASANLLIPNAVSGALFPNLTYDYKLYIISNAFNVSGAFREVEADFGFIGVIALSCYMGVISGYYYINRKRSIIYAALYSVICQMLVMTIFFNHFFYLPVAFQLVCPIFLDIISRFKSGKSLRIH